MVVSADAGADRPKPAITMAAAYVRSLLWNVMTRPLRLTQAACPVPNETISTYLLVFINAKESRIARPSWRSQLLSDARFQEIFRDSGSVGGSIREEHRPASSVQQQKRRGIGVGEEPADDAGLLVGAVGAAPVGGARDAGKRRDRPVDRPQNRADGDVAGRLDEHVAAGPAAAAGDERPCASGRGECARGTCAGRRRLRRSLRSAPSCFGGCSAR